MRENRVLVLPVNILTVWRAGFTWMQRNIRYSRIFVLGIFDIVVLGIYDIVVWMQSSLAPPAPLLKGADGARLDTPEMQR